MNETRAHTPFVKMQGLGNDFVIFDGRRETLVLSAEQARAVADRRYGVGCDQVITLQPSSRADCFMRIQNADGGEVGACGNVTRCVAKLLMQESGGSAARIETAFDVLEAVAGKDGLIAVDMGAPRLDWREIPLAREMDTLTLDLRARLKDGRVLERPAAVNIGNPHAIFFVADAAAVDPADAGPALERDPLFPERANISFASVAADGAIRLRVWERGAGVTEACGSAACATLVAAHRRGLTGRKARIVLDGGALLVEWRDNGRVVMTGPGEAVFRGALDLAALEREARL